MKPILCFCIMPSLVGLALLLFIAVAARGSEPKAVDYSRDIKPLLAAHCFACHGPKEEEGGLRLDVRERVLKGGMSGPALVVGKPDASLIYQFITGRNEDKIIMPPKDKGRRLSDAECELIRRWIEQGARWSE